jgi:serine/threonine-protein kinase
MSQPGAPDPSFNDDPAASLPAGTLIAGKYQLERMIGKGGMGSVWAAMHLGLHQPVAVKLISQYYARSAEARQRFDREAKAAARLKSRHVVQIYDNGETADGTPYIVMELLDGEPLDARIKRLGRLSLEQTVPIVIQIGRALSKAHAVGIVHRDLKPENVFLARDEDGEVAKVLDFGIAKIKTTDPGSSGTRTGTVLGTPLFMSPEQARGLRTVDHRTDIYSLGMVVYMMLTGSTAFSGESFGDILLAICTGPLPSVEAATGSLPPGVDTWFSRACAREPAERFGSVEEAVDALAVLAGYGRPMLASRDNISGVTPGVYDPSTLQRSPSAAGASAIRAAYGEPPVEIPKTGGKALFIGVVVAAVLALGIAAVFLAKVVLGHRGVDAPAVSGLVATVPTSAQVLSAPLPPAAPPLASAPPPLAAPIPAVSAARPAGARPGPAAQGSAKVAPPTGKKAAGKGVDLGF